MRLHADRRRWRNRIVHVGARLPCAAPLMFHISAPPLPLDTYESKRVQENRRRRRMLYGFWRQDLEERLRLMLGAIRKEAWGEPDLSSNVFRASVSATAVLYDRQPVWRSSDAGGDVLLEEVERSGRWSLMQRLQRDTIGIREMFMRVDALRTSNGDLEIRQRPVAPDMVQAVPDPENPEQPIEIAEARLRGNEWTWDVHSAIDGTIRIFNANRERDLSDKYGGVVELPQDPDGKPTLPWGVWHASRTGQLFDSFELLELVEGSLTCALYWTFFGHIFRNTAWRQRYILNARVAGAGQEGSEAGNRDAIVTDPSTVLMLESLEESTGQPLISQWNEPAAPDVCVDAIGVFERRVAAYAGISPADVQRVAGDPRSGFAIALNTDAKRESQRRYEPAFRPSDEAFMRTTAIVANAAMGKDVFPVDGYRVTYAGLPSTPEERREEREHLTTLLDKGLTDPIRVYRILNPELDDAGAKKALIQSRLEALRLEAEVKQLAAAEGLGASAEKQEAVVGIVGIAKEIFMDSTMTPEMKRAALMVLGGLQEADADALIATLPKPEIADVDEVPAKPPQDEAPMPMPMPDMPPKPEDDHEPEHAAEMPPKPEPTP